MFLIELTNVLVSNVLIEAYMNAKKKEKVIKATFGKSVCRIPQVQSNLY